MKSMALGAIRPHALDYAGSKTVTWTGVSL